MSTQHLALLIYGILVLGLASLACYMFLQHYPWVGIALLILTAAVKVRID